MLPSIYFRYIEQIIINPYQTILLNNQTTEITGVEKYSDYIKSIKKKNFQSYKEFLNFDNNICVIPALKKGKFEKLVTRFIKGNPDKFDANITPSDAIKFLRKEYEEESEFSKTYFYFLAQNLAYYFNISCKNSGGFIEEEAPLYAYEDINDLINYIADNEYLNKFDSNEKFKIKLNDYCDCEAFIENFRTGTNKGIVNHLYIYYGTHIEHTYDFAFTPDEEFDKITLFSTIQKFLYVIPEERDLSDDDDNRTFRRIVCSQVDFGIIRTDYLNYSSAIILLLILYQFISAIDEVSLCKVKKDYDENGFYIYKKIKEEYTRIHKKLFYSWTYASSLVPLLSLDKYDNNKFKVLKKKKCIISFRDLALNEYFDGATFLYNRFGLIVCYDSNISKAKIIYPPSEMCDNQINYLFKELLNLFFEEGVPEIILVENNFQGQIVDAEIGFLKKYGVEIYLTDDKCIDQLVDQERQFNTTPCMAKVV